MPTAAELAGGTEWTGTFEIAIEVWDYCRSDPGELELTLDDTYTHQEDFSFATSAPFADTFGDQETNPFYVSAGSDPDDPGPVSLTIFSAGLIAIDPQDEEPILHQYWNLEYADGRLTGSLADDGRELGAAYNVFYDENPLVPCQSGQLTIRQPYPMQEGASVEADITSDEVTLVMEGRSFDEARRWKVEASATRS